MFRRTCAARRREHSCENHPPSIRVTVADFSDERARRYGESFILKTTCPQSLYVTVRNFKLQHHPLRESLKRNARPALKPRRQGSEGEDDGEEEEEAEEEEVKTVPGADVRPTRAGKKSAKFDLARFAGHGQL